MTINLHIPVKEELLRPTITVIGVGGAGGNAVNNMIASNLEGVNFVVANTDAQALDNALTERTIQLGAGVTRGLGAGAHPEVGRASAEEARDEIAAYIEGSNMVFITAGMGGGTGTGAAPVVARIAKELGVLTVGVVTKPFQFEGSHRMKLAENGLKELQDYVDTLIIIPNQNLFRIANERTTFADAFKMADEVLHSGVRGVTDLMVKPGLINLDFADIRTVMREMGKAMMGTGEATGDRRAIEAAEAAISNPLLDDVSLKGARALLISVTGGTDMTLFEVDEAANRVREEVDSDANIIFGSTLSEGMDGRLRVSVVATGIDIQQSQPSSPKPTIISEVKKPPYTFSSSTLPKAEPIRPIARVPSYEISRDVSVRPNAEQRTAPNRVEKTDASPAQILEDAESEDRPAELRPVAREVSTPTPPISIPPEQRAEFRGPQAGAMPRKEQRETPREEPAARGLFQRIADVGRALAPRHEESEVKPQIAERVHVVQRPAAVAETAEKIQPRPDEDQYLDIPAFLRRQAN